MSNNVTVTGNRAQFNEDATFLKNVIIKGALQAGGTTSAGSAGKGVQIGDNLNVSQDLTVGGITTTKDLTVERFTDLQGITTTRSDLIIGEPGIGITIRPFNYTGTTGGNLAFLTGQSPTTGTASTDPVTSQLTITSLGIGIGNSVPRQWDNTRPYLQIGDVFGYSGVSSERLLNIYRETDTSKVKFALGSIRNDYRFSVDGNAIFNGTQFKVAPSPTSNTALTSEPLITAYSPEGYDGSALKIGGVGIRNADPGRIQGQTELNIGDVTLHINKTADKSIVFTEQGYIGAGVGVITNFKDRGHRLALNEYLDGSTEDDNKYVFVDTDGRVGIATSSVGSFAGYDITKPIKLDVKGNARIHGHLYDSSNSPGVNGYYLQMDAGGIRWIEASPIAMEGIYVQDEGVLLPNPGAAQTFSTINFVDVNSLGVGTDTITAIPDPDNPTNIARINSKDLWGVRDLSDVNTSIYRDTKVGIKNIDPQVELDVTGELHVTQAVDFDNTLNVDDNTTLGGTLDVTFKTTLNDDLQVEKNTLIKGQLEVDQIARFDDLTDATNTDDGAVQIDGGVGIKLKLFVGGDTKIESETVSNSTGTGALVVAGGVGIASELNVGYAATFKDSVELDSSLIDVTGNISGPGLGQTDWRLSSVGTGVSWRPPGVQTKRTIWVTKNGSDYNSGLLEGDAKATVGAAASIANEDDTIKVRAGVYYENNPIGLRTDVSITGEDLRHVTIIPTNPLKDVVHVRNGCLVENVNFTGQTKYTSHKGAGAVAFPPPAGPDTAASGYLSAGPFKVPPGKRYKSPYVRNCTNFMCESIGMKIDGDNATAETFGQDLKSMVCDSFTQYNEAGVGVSLTNDGYAQLVSIFTINCDIAIFAGSGGQCDLTNSNSSFGNFGLVAVGLGSTQFTGFVSNTNPAGDFITATEADTDTIVCADVFDTAGNPRRPFDGQALFFKIDLDNYSDVQGSGILTEPLEQVESIKIYPGANVSGYSPLDPPGVIIRDADGTQDPKGPQGIIAEASASVDPLGNITSINVVATGRNYLPTQNIVIDVEGNTGIASAQMEPIFYTVDSASNVVDSGTLTGITSITFAQFIPYQLFPGDEFSLQRISRILTSSHSFEYVGTGTDINTSTPLQGAIPIKANEIVPSEGAQIPFTSTDQKGNFDIGEGIQIDQTTSTIRGRDFSRAIQAEVTPLILALR